MDSSLVSLDDASVLKIDFVINRLKSIGRDEEFVCRIEENLFKEGGEGAMIKPEDLHMLIEKWEQVSAEGNLVLRNKVIQGNNDNEKEKQGITSLPEDVLTNIFKLVQSPLLITRLCQNFRNLAIETPTLWTRVCSAMPPQILNLYISRSKAAPLSICLNVISSERTGDFLEIVAPHIGRWSKLDLPLGDWVIAEYFRLSLKDSKVITISALREINCIYMGRFGVVPHLMDTTKITKLGLEYTSRNRVDVTELMKNLEEFTNLLHLNLDIYTDDIITQGFISPPEKALKSIEHFSLFIQLTSFMEVSPFKAILTEVVSKMDMPSLTKMTIKLSRNSNDLPRLSFPETFLKRLASFRYLTRLNFIADRYCKPIDAICFVTDLLKHCPSLQHIYIQARAKQSEIRSCTELLLKEPWCNCCSLKSLEFDNCNGLSPQDIIVLGQSLRLGRNWNTFEFLKIFRCNLLDENFLHRVEEHMEGKLLWTAAKVPSLSGGQLTSDPSNEWVTIGDRMLNFYRWK